MKAAVLNDFGQPLNLEDIQLDPPRTGEVQLRIGATGVCHSDYHVIKGEWKYDLPMILGHEAAGIVEVVQVGGAGDHAGNSKANPASSSLLQAVAFPARQWQTTRKAAPIRAARLRSGPS